MSVKINPSQGGYEPKVDTAAKAQEQAAAETKQATEIDTTDTYEKATPEKSVTYTPDMNKVKAMKADFSRQVDAFNKMVQALFSRQAGATKGATFDLLSAFEEGGLKARLEGLTIDEAARSEAEAMIAEDGEWGVEKTAQRIVDFAKALSGGDPAKIELLEKAVEDGFKQAESIWGGELPDISQKTYDRVKELFQAWKDEGKTEAATESETE